MDVFERLNRKFGVWYEGLFGAAEGRDLRPRDILRRILAAMEDGRREGLDGLVYVPNVYTLQIAVESEEERSYLRTFLSADELVAAVARGAEQHGYQIRGPLLFTVEEVAAPKMHPGISANADRVRIQCRFDTQAAAPTPPVVAPSLTIVEAPETQDEPGTIPALRAAALASLIVRNSDGALQDVYPLTARGARIGRGRQAGNDILLAEDGMVSKSHATLAFQAGRFTIQDENTTNGTTLNGEALVAGRAYPLESGDEIGMGQTLLVFRTVDAAATGNAPPEPPESVSAPDWHAAPQSFRLVAGDGEMYPLASSMSVGRSLTSDIVVIGNGVATQHARLTVRGETVYVEDLRSAGGTRVNGESIPPEFPVALYDGDQVAFGEPLFRLLRGRTA